MILIVGSSHDDILYFESIMTSRRSEKLFDTYDLTIGNIFNQEVMLVDNIHTNNLSSAIVTALIAKYYVILVFVVGRCGAFSKDWKLGEFALSKRIIMGDVDVSPDTDAFLGQIPGFPQYYSTQEDVYGYLTGSFGKRINSDFYPATYVSTNAVYTSSSELRGLAHNDSLFGAEKRVVFDNNAAGVALACHLAHVPYIAAKVVSRFLDKPYDVNAYAATLGKYIELDRGIVATIGDIGRNDLLGGNN